MHILGLETDIFDILLPLAPKRLNISRGLPPTLVYDIIIGTFYANKEDGIK